MRLEITLFTDPACPFAFSAEPVRMRLRWHYGDGLVWRTRMIVLTLEPGEAERLAEGAPGLQRRYGMPIDPRPYPRPASSEPACFGVVAARLHAPEAEEPLLRRLRVRVMLGGLLDDPELIAAAARDAGLDPAQLEEWCTHDDVLRALQGDVEAARSPAPAARALDHKLGGPKERRRYTAPSYEMARADGAATPVVIPGFNPIEAYETAIANLAPEQTEAQTRRGCPGVGRRATRDGRGRTRDAARPGRRPRCAHSRCDTARRGRRLLLDDRRRGLKLEPLSGGKRLRPHRVAAGMPRVADDDELRVGPGARELKGGRDGRAEVKAAVDEHAWNAGEARCVAQKRALLEPGRVREVVRTDADEGELGVRRPVAVGRPAVRLERDDGVLPCEPVGRRLHTHVLVGVLHQPCVRGEHVVVAGAGMETLPRRREEAPNAAVEPVELGPSAHGHAEEDDLGHTLRVPLRVREDQRRSPRATVEKPALDAEVPAQQLHVGEQIFRGVHVHIGRGITRVRRAPTAAPLVEEHDPIPLWVEIPPTARAAPRARAAVDDKRGLAVGVAARLPVDAVAVTDVE